ncbi:MAG: HDIG domain-containing protein [Chlorobi bacterium]|nr:HDIG domain-containing protein [Chlorobiota bacterium]
MRDRDVERRMLDTTKALFSRIEKITTLMTRFRTERSLAKRREDSLKIVAEMTRFPLELATTDWNILFRATTPSSRRDRRHTTVLQLRMLVDEGIRMVNTIGVLDRPKSEIRQTMISLPQGKIEITVPKSKFLDRQEALSKIEELLSSRLHNDTLITTLRGIAESILQPNIILDEQRTQIAQQWNASRVPRTMGTVKENERIISRHERITPETKAKLESFQAAWQKQMGDTNVILEGVGRAGHVAVILFLFVIYLYLFRKKIFDDNSKLLLISILILFVSSLAYFSYMMKSSDPVEYLILVPTASMLLTVIFDSRVGYNITVVMALLAGAICGGNYSIIVASLVAGALGVYTVRDIKNRTQIFRSLAFIFLGYAVCITFFGLQRSEEISKIMMQLGYALGNSIISPVLTFGLLIFFEKFFGITTDLTLLELSDYTHPLLRELSTKAPGTFHHSINMASMAEAAAKEIGANPILARVGAYYHDIGKIVAPEFFVENQISQINRHDDLDPKESARIIIDHVREGVALGRKYGLPERILEFIPAHHGKTIVSYFYAREKEQARDVSKDEFRYPGPRPRSKETAIVMLADTIEAAARAIDEPTPEKIKQLIDSIVTKRLNEGELDEADITMQDLFKIKKSFLGILLGIHHNRIKYPSQEEEQKAKKLVEQTAKTFLFPNSADALIRRIKHLGKSEE